MSRSLPGSFGSGAVIGTLGGLIGLGGAEFRLPLLITFFRFHGLEAVVLNKTISLVVVISALLFRANTISLDQMVMCWPICATLLTGSLVGAWVGADWATRLRSETLYRIIAVLLVIIAAVLLFAHSPNEPAPVFTGWPQLVIGITVGFAIGVIASLLGVAGGEFLIPTIVLLFGQELKLAGSLSLAVSLPTMLVGLIRYSRDESFSVIRSNWLFLLVMAAGSIVGTFIGGLLLGLVSNAVLLPLLAALLVFSAVKVWPRQRTGKSK